MRNSIMSWLFGNGSAAGQSAAAAQVVTSGTIISPSAYMHYPWNQPLLILSSLSYSPSAFQTLDPDQQRLWRAVIIPPSPAPPTFPLTHLKRLARIGPGFFAQLVDMGFSDWL